MSEIRHPSSRSAAPAWLEQAREHWTNRGQARPAFAIEPADGQESVWDYPRPPALQTDPRRVVVTADGVTIADSGRAVRILETASPPTFYVPMDDVRATELVAADGRSFCEWKGQAQYWALQHQPAQPVGWSYPQPLSPFEELVDHIAFYPDRVACTVAGEVVRAQAGGFYGGWITDEIVGPFKGDPGTSGW